MLINVFKITHISSKATYKDKKKKVMTKQYFCNYENNNVIIIKNYCVFQLSQFPIMNIHMEYYFRLILHKEVVILHSSQIDWLQFALKVKILTNYTY